MATHYDIERRAEVASTQDDAARAIESTQRNTLVVADRQVEGRGRQGRSWVEPDRGLYSSFAFTSSWDPADLPLLTLCAGVAVRRAVAEVVGVTPDLKWPNDLLVTRDKVGGILSESADSVVVIGCGMNLWWNDPIEGAGALYDTDPGPDAAMDLATAWVDAFTPIAEGPASLWPRDEYTAACVSIGAPVSWATGSGTGAGIAADGALIVATSEGDVAIHQGDVHLSDRG